MRIMCNKVFTQLETGKCIAVINPRRMCSKSYRTISDFTYKHSWDTADMTNFVEDRPAKAGKNDTTKLYPL
jgi:hypothetical protein